VKEKKKLYSKIIRTVNKFNIGMESSIIYNEINKLCNEIENAQNKERP
jgi:hypothetical protein